MDFAPALEIHESGIFTCPAANAYAVDRIRTFVKFWGFYLLKFTKIHTVGIVPRFFHHTGEKVLQLGSHCGTPSLTWRVFTGEEPGFWTGAGRF